MLILKASALQMRMDSVNLDFFPFILCGKSGIGFAHPYAAAGILAQNKKEELSQVNLDFSSLLFCAERVGLASPIPTLPRASLHIIKRKNSLK